MTSATEARYLRITFTDGTQRAFAYSPVIEDAVFARRAMEMMNSPNLVLSMDDRLEIFPMVNIRSIEVAPRPGKEMPTALEILHEFGV